MKFYAYLRVEGSAFIFQLLGIFKRGRLILGCSFSIVFLVKLLPWARFCWKAMFFATKAQTFIDLGCGSGQLLQYKDRMGLKSFGADISTTGLDVASERGFMIFHGDF
jgi:2-polyprenyl-3-methyl-5-hydroxy-6-metoxy-1,4-benzoquinol methylase